MRPLRPPRSIALAACLASLLGSAAACNYPSAAALPVPAETASPPAGMPLPEATGSPAFAGPTPTTALAPRPFPITDPPGATFHFTTRAGDTLPALARRFGVEPGQIISNVPLSISGYLPEGQALEIPNVLESMSPGGDVLPDAELVYSPTAADFDVEDFVASAGGYLAGYREMIPGEAELDGAQIVQKVADDNSINPRLLLALIELRSGWVFGSPASTDAERFPVGFRIPARTGLYQELSVAATQLSRGYYGWRLGTSLETHPDDGGTIRWNPTLNAGSVAVMHLYALLSGTDLWMGRIAGPEGFIAGYQAMFGDPWQRAAAAGPLLTPDLEQPPLELPFASAELWSLTAGPHYAWSSGTPRAALDFSPITAEEPCAVSARWATAAARGLVVRAADNVVALDLEMDGRESTGWTLVYYHLARDGLVAEGALVNAGDPLGHPSCEGGRSTGKHVHVARKFNGEWIEADGPAPFVLSGWRAVADERNYYGMLVRGTEMVTSDSSGQRGSTIWR